MVRVESTISLGLLAGLGAGQEVRGGEAMGASPGPGPAILDM